MKFILLLAWLTYFAQNAQAANITAKEIMEKNESARKLLHLTSDAFIATSSTGGEAKKKSFTWWRKLSTDQNHYLTLTRFHTPAEVRDEGILFVEKDAGASDVLLYLPTYKKIRRVETQSQSSSFMSSAFSYSDIASPHVDEYNYSLMSEGNCPLSPTLQCFVIESAPSTDAVKIKRVILKVKSGFARTTLCWKKQKILTLKANSGRSFLPPIMKKSIRQTTSGWLLI